MTWISASIEPPDSTTILNVTYQGESGGYYSDSAFYSPEKKKWYWDENETRAIEKVVAWAELPKPYIPSEAKKPLFPYGAIIGDIVGSKYEFDNIRTKNFEFWADDAFFTDDTIMTIAVYMAISTHLKTPNLSLSQLLIDSMQTLGCKYPSSYGLNFQKWLHAKNPRPYNSFGNGSAMRVTAAGFLAKSMDEAIQYATASASVTHNHPYGIRGAVSVAVGIYMARNGCSKESIRAEMSKYWCLNFTLDEIRESYSFDESCQGTVPQAIVAFLESANFEDAIRNAISIGGDSDTLAAITGSLAEAFYGIPETMKQKALTYLDDDLKNMIKHLDSVGI